MLLAEFGVGVGVGLMPARFPDGKSPLGGVVPEPKFPEQAASAAPTRIRIATNVRALVIELRSRYVNLAAQFHELFGLFGHPAFGVVADVLRDLHRAEMRPAHRAEVRDLRAVGR